MKRKIFISILISISTLAFSQDYLEEITLGACECLITVSDTLEPERFAIEQGLCILNAANPYKKELKKDYNIDLNKTDGHVDELSMIIALKMATVCSDTLMIIGNKIKKNEQRLSKPDLLFKNLVIADKHYKEKNYKLALFSYEECNKIDSTLGIVNYRLGVCYFKLFEFQISEEYYKKSIKLEYRKGDALFNLALNFSSQQENKLALKYFELALKELPNDEYIQFRIFELKALLKP